MENVPGLLAEHGGMGIILGDLAESGYDAEWDCIPAAAVGAPHLRDRVWLVAYPNGSSRTADERQHPAVERPEQPAGDGQGRLVAHPDGQGQLQPPRRFGQEWGRPCHCRWWDVEPAVARVGHGISRRVDRERTLGNAVVPQVAEHIGRLILQQIPGAAARPVSVRPTTSPNAEGVPGESAAAPVHQSKTEVAERPRRVRPALFLSERPTSVLDVTHTTRGTP
jgi:DNA (cytosine-5)-methyltransferase 1